MREREREKGGGGGEGAAGAGAEGKFGKKKEKGNRRAYSVTIINFRYLAW